MKVDMTLNKETKSDFADDWVFLTNTLAQAKSLLHSLEQVIRGIGLGLYTNLDNTEFICFNEDDSISLNGKPWKLVDLFIYLSRNISLTERDVNICIHKAWIVINKLLTIWKADFSIKTKQESS